MMRERNPVTTPRTTLLFPPPMDDDAEPSSGGRADRQSERPTLRAMPIVTPEARRTSATPPLSLPAPPRTPSEILSASFLVDASDSHLPTASSDASTSLWVGAEPSREGESDRPAARASTERPALPLRTDDPASEPDVVREREVVWSGRRRALGRAGLVAAAAAVVVLGAMRTAWTSADDPTSTRTGDRALAAMHGHERVRDRVGLSTERASAWDDPAPPSGACRLERGTVVVAARTRLATAPSAVVTARGFVIAHAPASGEVEAVRLDDRTLAVAERARTREIGAIADDAARALVEVTSSGSSFHARSAGRARAFVWPDAGEPFALDAGAGAVAVRRAFASSGRHLWWLPRSVAPSVSRPITVTAAVGASAGGVAKTSGAAGAARPPTRSLASGAGGIGPASPADVWLSASPRDEGGAVVALRVGGDLRVGGVDAALAAEAPLVGVSAKANAGGGAKVVGAPAIVAHGTGSVVAWSEKDRGGSRIRIGSVTREGEVVARDLGPGAMPALVELPDGDLLVALVVTPEGALGEAGARRISVVRLATDLAPRGSVLVVSPEGASAMQPSLALRADGRGVVAFVAADDATTGRVLATPIACDPGL